MTPSFLSVTPMIPAGPSLAEAVAFFTDHLGFTVAWQAGEMAGVERDRVAFHLVKNTSREWAANASFSIGVADLSGLHEEYRRIPARVGALEVKSWGRREFHVVLPSGVCLQFYQQSGD